jgi:inhibitor of cysteine peptidase
VAAGSSSIGIACEKPADPASPPTRLFRVLAVVKAAAPRRSVTLEEPDNGSQIFLTQGERLFVKLPSSPTTGYGWTVARNAVSVLQPVGDPRFEAPEKALPGASGYQIFEFRIVAGGASSLAMVYRRPFEKDQPPARTWAIFLSAAAVSATSS